MKHIALISPKVASIPKVAVTKPQVMDDEQLGAVVAGLVVHPVGPTKAPPFWNPPEPMPVNPGGPILISCMVNGGCTIRRV